MITPDDAHGTHGMDDDQNTAPDPASAKDAAPEPASTKDAATGAPADASADAAPATAPAGREDGGLGRDEGDGDGPGAGLGDDLDWLGDSADEAALRAMLRDAVRDIEAAPDALDHLRRAIPARRQHRRQALAGAAAALVLAGMAVPALIRAAGTSGSADASPANVASSHAPAPGEDGHTDTWPGDPSYAPSSGPGGTGVTPRPPTGSNVSTEPATPTGTTSVIAPDCSSAQLGKGASKADAPDAAGRVYGWFRVANVSTTPCTIASGGRVQALAHGAADANRIVVMGHTPGDPASGLPAASNAPVVLAPGADYEVQFAWVPDSNGPGGCPAPTTTPPTATPTDTATATGGADAPSGTDPGTNTGANAPASGGDTPVSAPPASVALNHTPAAGAPVIDGPVIQNACAGTVYTTTALPAPATSTTTGAGS